MLSHFTNSRTCADSSLMHLELGEGRWAIRLNTLPHLFLHLYILFVKKLRKQNKICISFVLMRLLPSTVTLLEIVVIFHVSSSPFYSGMLAMDISRA